MINWKDSNLTKDIFQYIINKITNQEKEGIKQLKENEYIICKFYFYKICD